VSKIIYYMSMSADGYVTAAGATAEQPLGIGGQQLHDWTMEPSGAKLLEDAVARVGAVICGRNTYDQSLSGWGLNGPTGDVRLPVFVLTHRPTPDPPAGGVYTLVTEGVDTLVRQAKAAAGDKDVSMSGSAVGRELLQAGHVDELWVSLVPVLFGDGARFYEHAGGHHIRLDMIEAIPTATVTHLHYRVRLEETT
jgi:dihydrofolate reductase